MLSHCQDYCGGKAWANESARMGYGVLVHDVFPFASRLVDVSDVIAGGLVDERPEDTEQIERHNRWVTDHEDVMAKSLFCGGTTWPCVFLAEDQAALSVLCSRKDIDEERVGGGGLSGGASERSFLAEPMRESSMRRDDKEVARLSFEQLSHPYLDGLSPCCRAKWTILGLRVPLPTMVLNDEDDNLFTLGEMQAGGQDSVGGVR